TGPDGFVPELQGRMVVLLAERAEGPGVQPLEPRDPDVEAEVAGRERAEAVAVSEQQDRAAGVADLEQEPVHPRGHLPGRLAARTAVAEQLPPRPGPLDVPGGDAL